MEENIFQAHYRIYNKLIFMVSCFNPNYAMQYLKNINNKTFKKYFKLFKSDEPKEINEIYEKINEKIMIVITKLPIPELYSFNFIKDIFHIHIAIPNWKNSKEYNEYTSNIEKIPVQKFVNVKDKTDLYNNDVEEKLFQHMITLIDRKLNNTQTKPIDKFERMAHTGGKIFLLSNREFN